MGARGGALTAFGVSLDDGWIDAELAAELPGLLLRTVGSPYTPGPPSPGVRQQLRHLSDRMTGAKAIGLRREPIASAYRVFFRQVGLDPDVTLTPVEQAAADRLIHGGYRSRGRVEDAELLALVETGVPVWVADEATLLGPLGVRPARAGERLGAGPHADDLWPGHLILADSERPVGRLHDGVGAEHRVGQRTRRVRLAALGVAGVPRIHVEEALGLCAEALHAG